MCGIAGFYKKTTKTSRSALHATGQKMIESLAHRGPDHNALWQDPDVPVLLAHRRLSIIDLSPEGHQPMSSSSERYVITYNGEIYNYLDLQKDLNKAGFTFRGHSDTEVFLAAVEHWGLNLALQKINGMFAFALWDRKERCLHFVRDRLGKKPLYVGWAGKGDDAALVFASELKAFHAHPDFKPEIDQAALNTYMNRGYVSAPYCIYKNVWALPAGFRLTIETENISPLTNLAEKMAPYWHHLKILEESRTAKTQKPEEQIVRDFEALLTTCVQDRMISDVPLGAFLSGGIDSSAVVALMQKTAASPVKTYCVGFEEEGFNEAVDARKVAEYLGTDHHELYLKGTDALGLIPQLPVMYDEPFADISAIPTYLVSKFARRDVTVALSGDGGDEMLGGYTRHFMGPKIHKWMKRIPGPLRKTLSRRIEKIPPERWSRLRKSKPGFGLHMHKLASVLSLDTQEEIYERLNMQWPGLPLLDKEKAPLLADKTEWQPGDLSFPEKMMYWDALSYLPNDILTKVDRASMAVSLETRAPLLDYRIYKYVWSLPEHFKIRSGQGKYLLRRVLKRHLPPALFERPKQGFNTPVGDWLRGPLKDWGAALLDPKTLREQGYLDADQIQKMWQTHLSGQGNTAGALWTVLMFQAWQEKWIKRG